MTAPILSGRLHRRRLLLALGLAALPLAGCTLEAPTPPTPSPEPDAPVEPTAAPVPQATPTIAPPTATPVPAPTVAPTQPPARNGIAGRLLYARRGNLYLLSGTTSTKLSTTSDRLWPRWSPDGTRFVSVRRGDAYSDLLVSDADGQNETQLTKHQSKAPGGSKEYAIGSVWATWPAWEPSGTRLLYAADVTASHMSLWQIDAKGGAPRPLPGVADLGANIEAPAYAPDGKSIAFCISFDTPTQLWLLNLTAGTRVPLTDGKQTVYDPAWAPDGKTLIAAVVAGPRSALYHFDGDGKERGPLGPKLAARAPTWSPDGKQLAFVGEEGGRFNIYVVDLAGSAESGFSASEPRRLTSDGDIDAPSGLSWAR